MRLLFKETYLVFRDESRFSFHVTLPMYLKKTAQPEVELSNYNIGARSWLVEHHELVYEDRYDRRTSYSAVIIVALVQCTQGYHSSTNPCLDKTN